MRQIIFHKSKSLTSVTLTDELCPVFLFFLLDPTRTMLTILILDLSICAKAL